MPTVIGRDEVQRLAREENALIVDAMPSKEYEDEHLPGAINLPIKELGEEAVAGIDRDRPIVVYCWDLQ
jgi:rhodanese-related sulfurtransferase